MKAIAKVGIASKFGYAHNRIISFRAYIKHSISHVGYITHRTEQKFQGSEKEQERRWAAAEEKRNRKRENNLFNTRGFAQ